MRNKFAIDRNTCQIREAIFGHCAAQISLHSLQTPEFSLKSCADETGKASASFNNLAILSNWAERLCFCKKTKRFSASCGTA